MSSSSSKFTSSAPSRRGDEKSSTKSLVKRSRGKTHSSFRKSKEVPSSTHEALSFCRLHGKMMTWELPEEKKIPLAHKDAPTSLGGCTRPVLYLASPQSSLYKTVLTRMFGDRIYSFRLATSLNVSASGAGIINAVIQNSSLASNADFTSLGGVFDEFFIVQHQVQYQPVSRYQYPLTGTSALSVSSLPLGCAQLQHGVSAYTSQATMTENYDYAFHSTGDPFSYRWINRESSSSTVLPEITASVPTQSWCLVGGVANYTGSTQYLTQSAPPALPASQVIGTFLVEWEVLFRVRA